MRPLAIMFTALTCATSIALAAPQQSEHEKQLAGVQLLRSASAVIKAYGNPHRIQVGFIAGLGVQSPSGSLPPGIIGPGAAAPGATGEGMPAPGGAPMGPPMGMPMGMPAGPEGMGGAPGAQATPGLPQTVHWIYEQAKLGVVYVFGFDDQGKITAVTVGDGFEDSVNRGGSRKPVCAASTGRGIRLGDKFRDVIRAYGPPETQQNWSNEVILTYYEKYGLAFSLNRKSMRVTSITLREMSRPD